MLDICIATLVAIFQLLPAYLGWRVTMSPPNSKTVKRRYEAAFISSGIVGICLIGFAAIRTSHTQDKLDASIRKLTLATTNDGKGIDQANAGIDQLKTLTQSRPNDSPAEVVRAAVDKITKLEHEAKRTSSMYLVPVVNGVATPDLSRGSNQCVLLTRDTVIAKPLVLHMSPNATITWTLFLDQDATGWHTYTIPWVSNPMKTMPNTRSSMVFVTDDHGHTTLAALPVINLPIQK